MKLGENFYGPRDEIWFSLEGKPFDGWGPATSPSALGFRRTCELNCFVSEGGDCCESQEMCERGSCVEGSVCTPEPGCVSMTLPEYEDEYGGVNCSFDPEACLDYSEEPCPVGFMAQARQCTEEFYYLCLQSAKTGQSSCKYLQKTSNNYLKWCLFNTCYNSKEECQSCNDCACRSISSSSSNCGSDTCTDCEFCCEGKCVGCNSVERYESPCYQTGADSDCPYPLGQKDGSTPNSCGCHYSGLIGDGADRGCAECEFCVWADSPQGGLCLPCGEEYALFSDDDRARKWQCSEECMKISSSVSSKACVWTFAASYDDQTQAWSFEGSNPSGPKCLSQPLSYSVGSWFGGYSSDECKKKTFVMTTSNCVVTGDCEPPSPSEYPELPTQPAVCGPWYSCDYSWDRATNVTTYECKGQASYRSDYYGSVEECEAARESGSCISPTFDCKVTDFREHQATDHSTAKRIIQSFPLGVWCRTGDDRDFVKLCNRGQLFEILADNDHPIVGPVMAGEQLANHVFFTRILGCDPIFVLELGHSIFHAMNFRHGDSDFMADGLCDPAALFQNTPRNVEFLGPDKAENVAFTVIFPNQGCRQSEPSSGLKFGCDPEDRSW